MASASSVEPDPEDDRRVEARMLRKAVFSRATPPEFWAVIDEAALLHITPELRDQLEYLIEVSQRPNIGIQIIPTSHGSHAAMTGHFVIMEFPVPGPCPCLPEAFPAAGTPSGHRFGVGENPAHACFPLWLSGLTPGCNPSPRALAALPMRANTNVSLYLDLMRSSVSLATSVLARSDRLRFDSGPPSAALRTIGKRDIEASHCSMVHFS